MTIFTIILAVFLALLLIGLVIQKDLFSKFVFLSTISNITIVTIVAFGSYNYNESFLDIALIYSILSFIPAQSLLKLVLDKKAI